MILFQGAGRQMAELQNFFDTYWTSSGGAPPEHDPMVPRRIALLLQTLKHLDVKRILDVGCGNGFVAEQVRRQGYETIGMDVSKNAIERARSTYPEIQFVEGACDKRWPFEDETFDAIYTFEVIEHVLDTYTMLAEMNRTLKPGGILVLTTPFHGLIKNLFLVMFNFDKHFCNIKDGHIRFFTSKHLKRLLGDFGFEVFEQRQYGRMRPVPLGTYMAARKLSFILSK